MSWDWASCDRNSAGRSSSSVFDATADGAARCQDDEALQATQRRRETPVSANRAAAKLNYPFLSAASWPAGPEVATSCLTSAVSSPRPWRHESGEASWSILEESTSCKAWQGFLFLGDMRAAKRVGRYLRKAPVAWQGFLFLACYTDADWASDKTSRRSTSGGVVTLGGGVLNSWAKKQKSVALSSWESELFAAITSGTRSLGIQSELTDLGYNCGVTVATDSQSVIDHSRRRGHSGASKHVGLRRLWLQEALVNGKLETGTREGGYCDESRWCMHQSVTWKSDSRAVSAGTSVRTSCAEVKNLNRAATLSLKGDMCKSIPNVERVLLWRRVSCEQQFDTFQSCCQFWRNQNVSSMHLWSAFSPDASASSVLLRTWRFVQVRLLPFSCLTTLWRSVCALSAPRDWLIRQRHGARTKQRASIHHISSTSGNVVLILPWSPQWNREDSSGWWRSRVNLPLTIVVVQLFCGLQTPRRMPCTQTRRDETMCLLSMSEMRSDHILLQNIKYKLQLPLHLTLSQLQKKLVNGVHVSLWWRYRLGARRSHRCLNFCWWDLINETRHERHLVKQPSTLLPSTHKAGKKTTERPSVRVVKPQKSTICRTATRTASLKHQSLRYLREYHLLSKWTMFNHAQIRWKEYAST